MKKLTSKIIFGCAVLGVAFTGGMASAQTVLIDPTTQDGGFESVTAKTDFSGVASSTSAVPFWGVATGAITDSGVQPGAFTGEFGNNGAFFKPSDGSVYNLTSHVIGLGDVYTLTYFAVDSNGGGTNSAITAALFSENPANATAGYTPVLTLATQTNTLTAGAGLAEFTLTYTASAADVGNVIGITAQGGGNDYNGVDNFTLTVQSVPEPSTYALLFAGMGGLLLARRFRRLSA